MKLRWELAGIFGVCAIVFGAAALMQAAEQPSQQTVQVVAEPRVAIGGEPLRIQVTWGSSLPPEREAQLDR
jgi:hypothetical protein